MDDKICSNKECSYAGAPQPIENFCTDRHTKTGYSSYCKSCRARKEKAYHATPKGKETLRKASEKYKNSDHGKERIKDNYLSPEYREKANAYQREYNKRPECKLRNSLKMKGYRIRNTLKEKARGVVGYAVECGRLIVPELCDWCGKPLLGDVERHHWRGYDPDHWLDIKFVHKKCHELCEDLNPEDWFI